MMSQILGGLEVKKTALILTSLILLTSCGKADVDLTNASMEDVAKATASAETLTPGDWSTVTEIVSVSAPGMPAQSKGMMDAISKQMVGKKSASQHCLTPEQAKRPDAGMFAGKDNGSCRFDRFALSGGTMNATVHCNPPGGRGEMVMAMKGLYGGESYALTSEMTMSGMPGAAGGKGMTIKASSKGTRTGACKAS
jgi:hypothetical protein